MRCWPRKARDFARFRNFDEANTFSEYTSKLLNLLAFILSQTLRYHREDKSSNPPFKDRPYFVLAANEEEVQKVFNKRPDIGAGSSATPIDDLKRELAYIPQAR